MAAVSCRPSDTKTTNMGRFKSPNSRSRSWNSPEQSSRHRSERSDKYSRRRGHSSSNSRSRSRSRSRSHSPASSFEGDEHGYRLHIADLAVDASRKDLEMCFSRFGRLVEVWLARSPQCFAFVVFEHKSDARAAITEMNGKKFCGQRIRVTKARPRTRGQRVYRGYNPNLRCYECGKKGHFSRDCRLNDKSNPKTRDVKTMSIKDLINWDITDDDIIRFNEVYHSPRDRSRSRSSSRSMSPEDHHRRRHRSRRRSRHSSSSSNESVKDENANSTKGEPTSSASTSATKLSVASSPTLPSDHKSSAFGIKSVVTTPAVSTLPAAYAIPIKSPSPKETALNQESIDLTDDLDHPMAGSYLHPKLTASSMPSPEVRTIVISKVAEEAQEPEGAAANSSPQ